MTPATVKSWRLVHEWTSLVCTLFLLLLCVTGLPLIFHDEIDSLGEESAAPAVVEAPARPDMDRVVDAARRAYPQRRVQFVTWLETPGQFRVGLSRDRSAPEQKPFALVDGATYDIIGEAWSEKDWRHGGVMSLLLMLHTNLLLGLAGQLFLGAMGLCFLASLVSGVVLYGPFMRKTEFAAVRRQRSRRLAWLDLHNLIGIATLVWALVVGFTGAVNTLDSTVFGAWQKRVAQQLKHEYAGADRVQHPHQLQRAVDTALAFMPGKEVSFVAFPGSMFATPRHYAVYLRGSSVLTSRLLHPVLIDADSARLVDIGDPPWYLWALEVSRPLHFGDYAGLPLKLLWAAFDLLTIVVLGSGLYLWLGRRRAGRSGQASAVVAAAR